MYIYIFLGLFVNFVHDEGVNIFSERYQLCFPDAPYIVRGISTYQENPYPHLFCFYNNTTYWTDLNPGRFGEKQKG